ncbi:DUF1048 domain-containing protein [Streptomyces sp. AN091965]|uniref:DUF1048 domain-containing protein n=1 Tax=Streptomyces sp. AN091965 TaxID=2927803 RepID=UPI001F61345C|nr:DUF1048 domain-containing protein [Streptomyces sp. AN091965]MCI3933031.1 DUF1048 domain-containing protein [Streptomyces sp. AN091965]
MTYGTKNEAAADAATANATATGAAAIGDTGLTRERVLAICRSNWEYRGIDDASLREMLGEFSHHLEEAAAAGRTPQDVVGPDVKAFAASWARAHTPLPLRVLRMGALIPFVVGSLLLLTHLIDRTLTLSIEAPRIAFYGALAAGTVTWEMRRGNLGFRGWILIGLAVLPVAALTGWLIGDDPLFHLPLWGTLLFLLPGLPYAIKDIRARKSEPSEG